jgi:hypothetical protein
MPLNVKVYLTTIYWEDGVDGICSSGLPTDSRKFIWSEKFAN